jgi:hypothetical protein
MATSALGGGAVRIAKSTVRDVSVKVVVRVRPMLECEGGTSNCVSLSDSNTLELERDSQALQYKCALLSSEQGSLCK